MRRPAWLLAVTALLLVAGGSWLASLLWKTTDLGGGSLAPHIVGALLGGFTLARIVEGRSFVLASSAALVWIGMQILVHRSNGTAPRWATSTSIDEYALLLAIAPIGAGLAAAIPLHLRETRWRWLSVSALLTLGCMVTPLVASTNREMHVFAIICLVASPLFAGALTQYLAPYRMIWTCGGGMLVFAFFILDQRPPGAMPGLLAGIGMYALVGAAGAAISWRIFRNRDPRTPTTTLPTATTVT